MDILGSVSECNNVEQQLSDIRKQTMSATKTAFEDIEKGRDREIVFEDLIEQIGKIRSLTSFEERAITKLEKMKPKARCLSDIAASSMRPKLYLDSLLGVTFLVDTLWCKKSHFFGGEVKENCSLGDNVVNATGYMFSKFCPVFEEVFLLKNECPTLSTIKESCAGIFIGDECVNDVGGSLSISLLRSLDRFYRYLAGTYSCHTGGSHSLYGALLDFSKGHKVKSLCSDSNDWHTLANGLPSLVNDYVALSLTIGCIGYFMLFLFSRLSQESSRKHMTKMEESLLNDFSVSRGALLSALSKIPQNSQSNKDLVESLKKGESIIRKLHNSDRATLSYFLMYNSLLLTSFSLSEGRTSKDGVLFDIESNELVWKLMSVLVNKDENEGFDIYNNIFKACRDAVNCIISKHSEMSIFCTLGRFPIVTAALLFSGGIAKNLFLMDCALILDLLYSSSYAKMRGNEKAYKKIDSMSLSSFKDLSNEYNEIGNVHPKVQSFLIELLLVSFIKRRKEVLNSFPRDAVDKFLSISKRSDYSRSLSVTALLCDFEKTLKEHVDIEKLKADTIDLSIKNFKDQISMCNQQKDHK